MQCVHLVHIMHGEAVALFVLLYASRRMSLPRATELTPNATLASCDDLLVLHVMDKMHATVSIDLFNRPSMHTVDYVPASCYCSLSLSP
jgi:hypothetical protein